MVSKSLNFKRISIFAGHYGSGKTNIAINYALELNKSKENVVIADLDIVNPYFRTKDSEEMLKNCGIRLISSEFADSNVDLPALPAETYSVTENKDLYAVLDVGGDDRGALALGRYVPAIVEENNYEMFFVVNKYRPLTRDAKSAIEVMQEIEVAAGTKFTAIVNNSNIGVDTTPEDIEASVAYAEEISKLTGLPVAFTAVRSDLADKVEIDNVIPIDIHVTQSWNRE